jgi:hypothetical protein
MVPITPSAAAPGAFVSLSFFPAILPGRATRRSAPQRSRGTCACCGARG